MEPCWKLNGRCATFGVIAATFAAIAAGGVTLFIGLRWVRNIQRIRHGSWNLVGSSTAGAQHSPQSPQLSPQSPRVDELIFFFFSFFFFFFFEKNRITCVDEWNLVGSSTADAQHRRNHRDVHRNRRVSRNLVHSSMVGAQHSPRVVEPCW